MSNGIDDYAYYLAEEAKSDLVALHQFKILHDPKEDCFHLFFEGEDDNLFYVPEARRYADGRVLHIYDCGGKRNVLSVRDDLDGEGYETEKCLFFVDRDFDDLLATQVVVDDRTYITDNYSIESDISTMDSARIVLDDVIRLSRADPEYSRIEVSLVRNFNNFYSSVRPLIAWILAAKEDGCQPNLKNTNGLNGIFQVTDTAAGFKQNGFSTFTRRTVAHGVRPDFQTVLKWRRLLDIRDAKKWVRGKYELWFFHSALLATLNETNMRRRLASGKTLRIPSSLREGRLFELLGGRLSVPASLTDFYKRRMT